MELNHRELMRSGRRKTKSHFLRLPEELQDRIIDGLDDGTMTLEGASALCGENSERLSHEAIANYYRAVRRERRLHQANLAVARAIDEFQDKPTAELLNALVNQVLSTAIGGLIDGEVDVRELGGGGGLLSGLAKIMGRMEKSVDTDEDKGLKPIASQGLSEQAADEIRKKILTGQ